MADEGHRASRSRVSAVGGVAEHQRRSQRRRCGDLLLFPLFPLFLLDPPRRAVARLKPSR